MPALRPHLLLLVLFACGDKDAGDDTAGSADGGSTDGGSADGGSGDGGSGDGGSGDGGSGDGLFFDASGTVNGASVTVACDESSTGLFYATQTSNGAPETLVGGNCTATVGESSLSVNIGVYADGPISGETCQPSTFGIQVVEGTGAFWNCAIDTTTTFSLSVDEWSEDGGGGITWGGDFAVAGESGSLGTIDLSGRFRFYSPAG